MSTTVFMHELESFLVRKLREKQEPGELDPCILVGYSACVADILAAIHYREQKGDKAGSFGWEQRTDSRAWKDL